MQFSSRKMARFAAIGILAPLFAACDSTVAPDLKDLREETACSTIDTDCRTGTDTTATTTTAGRLVFASIGEFQKYLEPLQNAPKADLQAAEARNGFESLRAYLDPIRDTEAAARTYTGNETRALQNDGVTRDDFPVGDAFLSVLNSDGEIEIAGRVFKVTRDYVYEVSPAYVSTLNQKVPTLSSDASKSGDPYITVHPVVSTHSAQSSTVSSPSAAGQKDGPVFHHVPGLTGDCYVPGGTDDRMHGRSYITNFYFFSEAGVSTEWEHKIVINGWTTWPDTWQDGTLRYSFTSALTTGPWNGPWNPAGPANGSQNQTGTAKVQTSLLWRFGWGVRIRGNIHSSHNVANGLAFGSCNTAVGA